MITNLFLLCVDPGSVDTFVAVKQALEDRGSCKVHFVNVCRKPPCEGSWLLEGYPAYSRNAPKDLFANAQYIRETYNLEPSTYYRSDLRLYNGSATELELCLEARYVLKRATGLLERHQPEYVFMPGGGNLYGNLFFEIAHKTGAKVFRIYPFHWINIQKGTRRYFINDNLWFEMDEIPGLVDSVYYKNACDKAGLYYDAVIQRSHNLDDAARKIASRNRFTPNLPGLIKDIGNYFLKSIVYRSSQGARGRGHLLHKQRIGSFLSCYYSEYKKPRITERDNFFIYILHQPTDSQLAFRGFPFSDQIAACRFIMANLPAGTKLYIKEHPVHPGMISIRDLYLLNKEFGDRCKFLNHTYRFRNVVSKARGVITINSTATLEAMILGVPVVVLGKGIYTKARSVHRVEKIYDIKKVLTEVLLKPQTASREDIIDLLTQVFCHCVPDPDIEGHDSVEYIVAGILNKVRQQ